MKLNPKRKYYKGADGKIRRCKQGHLLALYNERVNFAFGYCKLKQCYLTRQNISEKQCLMKRKTRRLLQAFIYFRCCRVQKRY